MNTTQAGAVYENRTHGSVRGLSQRRTRPDLLYSICLKGTVKTRAYF